MLRIFAVAVLAITMSAGLAEAEGHMAKPKTLSACQPEQQAKDNCACGPAKMTCKQGMWYHAFTSACTK